MRHPPFPRRSARSQKLRGWGEHTPPSLPPTPPRPQQQPRACEGHSPIFHYRGKGPLPQPERFGVDCGLPLSAGDEAMVCDLQSTRLPSPTRCKRFEGVPSITRDCVREEHGPPARKGLAACGCTGPSPYTAQRRGVGTARSFCCQVSQETE